MNENEINQEQLSEEKEQLQPDNAEVNDTHAKKTEAETNPIKKRFVSMLVLAVSAGIAGNVLVALIIGQTLFGFFTKAPNESMKELSKQLTDYLYKALNYLSFNSEERPFPYQAWDEEKQDSVIIPENVEPSA